MKVRAMFNSKAIENDMINAGMTATKLWTVINKGDKTRNPPLKAQKHILYDAVVRVVSGRSNKQEIVRAIADVLGTDMQSYRVSKAVPIRPDGRAGKRRDVREA